MLFYILTVLKSSFEMSYSEWKQAQESQYFNWKCLICTQLVISPETLEDQHLIEYGPYTDITGDKWIKCFSAYHIQCLKETIPTGKYMCTFMGCWQQISFNFSTSIYFLVWFKFYMVIFRCGKRSGRQKGEGQGPHGRGHGRANDGNDGGPGVGPGQGHGWGQGRLLMIGERSLPKLRKTGSAMKGKPCQEWTVLRIQKQR